MDIYDDTRTLADFRRFEGLTQKELASMVGISQNHLSNIENHKRLMPLYVALELDRLFRRVNLRGLLLMYCGAR